MALHRSFGPVLLASALAVGGLLPAASASAAPAEEPVSILALTTDDGGLTPVAEDGLEALSAPAQPQTRALRSSATTAQTTDEATDGADVPDDVAVLTAPVATPEFYVAGVTWDGADAMPEDAALFIRVMENGQWQDWAQLEVDAGTNEPGGVGGTEAYTAAGAEAVQVQITGDPARLPANVRLNLTPEWPSDEELVLADDAPAAAVAPSTDPVAPAPAAVPAYQQPAGQATSSQAAATTAEDEPSFGVKSSSGVPQPRIVTRAQWGADDSRVRHSDHVALRAAVIHHTAGTNNYTRAQSAGIVRGIHYYHAVSRGWGDIGYNFLVDKFGTIYEGRKGSLTAKPGEMVIGAHAAPRNTHTMGLSVMGDYTKARVPQDAMNAFADVIAWQFSRAGLTATDRSGLTSTGTYARPAGQNLGRVFAHRDVSNTACPGDEIYSKMTWLAQAADQRIAQAGGPATPVAPAPAPQPTPTPEPAGGHVYLNNGWGPIADVDYPFGAEGAEVLVGDWDGDRTDTLGTRRGNIFTVYNENRAGAEPWTIAYGKPTDDVFIGDWDGDGKDSIAVRRGATFYVKNKVMTGPADHEFVYGRPGDEVFVGDWNSDGKDTFAVRRGQILHVKNNFAGGPADEVIAYGKPGDTMLVGDWDGDGVDTFAVRRGAVYHVKNSIVSGPADLVIPYGREHDSVLVGDWNGDRTDTLGVYRPAR